VARWQNRYWTLEGCTLRYHERRGAPMRKEFDLRFVKHIEMAEGQPCELQLKFGLIRIWRLRAESREAARRWFLFLRAAHAVAGEPRANAEDPAMNFSDADSIGSSHSASSCSTTPRGSASLPARVYSSMKESLTRSPRFPPAPKTDLLSAMAVADRLEVDRRELDKRFEAWFGSGNTHSARRGLSEALSALWKAFGGEGLDGALAAWKGPQLPEPQAFAENAEGVLHEYLSRMLPRLEQWVKKSDPLPKEIEDVAAWFLCEARPALDTFEARSCEELNSKPFTAWRTIADQLENVLLGEWETRRCDEACSQIEASYTPSARNGARTDVEWDVLELLQGMLQEQAWQGHAAACDRSATVLVAALSAVLRSHKECAGALLALPDAGVPHPQILQTWDEPAYTNPWVSTAKRLINKVLQGVSTSWVLDTGYCITRPTQQLAHTLLHSINPMEDGASTSTPALRQAAAAAVAEATRLTSFCRTAQPASQANASVCADVLLAFAGAFEREGARICTSLAETHFVATHRQTLAEVRFDPDSQCATPKLTGAIDAAGRFLDAALEHPTSPGAAQICDALIRTIVQYWLRAFRRGQPRLSVTTVEGITTCITADVTDLRQLAARFGVEAIWASVAQINNPLQPMNEVCQMFSDPSVQGLDFGAARLEVMLGDERGPKVARAVRRAIAR